MTISPKVLELLVQQKQGGTSNEAIMRSPFPDLTAA